MQFTQGLHRAVQQQPEAIATLCEDRQHSFRQLHDRVACLAGGLKALGVRAGDRVGILALNSDRYLEAYLAIAWIGALVVPANFRWSTAEVVYALQDAECTALFIDDHFASQVETLLDDCMFLRNVLMMDEAMPPAGGHRVEELIARHEPIADLGVGGDETLGIFYTGGTTGAPKGVMLSHRSVCTSALSLMAEGAIPDKAVGLHAAPMFHLADMMLIVCLLLRGGTHVMLSGFKPERVLDLVEQHGITDLLLVPAMIQMLADLPATRQRNTASIQRILYGASPASEAMLDRAMQAIPTASLMQVYGMTETAAVMSVLPFSMHRSENRALGKLGAAGRSALHVQLRIVDEQDNELPRGSVGEITASGPNLMSGYLNQPEASAAALRNGWMHTGDMGYMDKDGYLFIVDRLKDMIISGGENIYSVEVEKVIAQHPAVAACAVIGIPCVEMGEKIHAAVVLRDGQTLALEDLYAHCKQFIAGYKCPRSLALLESLPVSGAGKVLKTVLRAPFWKDRERAVA